MEHYSIVDTYTCIYVFVYTFPILYYWEFNFLELDGFNINPHLISTQVNENGTKRLAENCQKQPIQQEAISYATKTLKIRLDGSDEHHLRKINLC